MKTVRDYITSNPATPAPPPSATHILCWEPHPRAARWELVALDARPDDDAPVSGLPVSASSRELAGFASGLLGPVMLSRRFEVQDEAGETAEAYYVIPG
jgi:hypothetical protein